MPWVGFEPTIPAFERAKTFHALDRVATVIGEPHLTINQLSVCTPFTKHAYLRVSQEEKAMLMYLKCDENNTEKDGGYKQFEHS
jgi:hypothetical protein